MVEKKKKRNLKRLKMLKEILENKLDGCLHSSSILEYNICALFSSIYFPIKKKVKKCPKSVLLLKELNKR